MSNPTTSRRPVHHPHRQTSAARLRPSFQVAAVAGAVLSFMLSCGSAHAFEFDTGNPDLSVRWDNTLRYNYANRVESRDPKIGNSAVADEGTYSFDKGQTVANRLDILTELDVSWRKRWGARMSAAGWYDGAYGSTSRSNPNLPLSAIPSYINHQYSDYTERF